MDVRRLSLALAAVVSLAAAAAAAEPENPFRPCRWADLVGVWEVIRFGIASGAPVDRSDPEYLPHQRYAFNANATAAYIAAASPPTPAEVQAWLAVPPEVTWALDTAGRLVRQRAGAAQLDTSECRVLTQPLRDLRTPVPALPGDVLLTDQGADERPIARRLLRKLRSGE
jgi:hypothetical protein